MEVAPFFIDFHHFLSIFTIFYRFSRFTHFCRDLHFVAIYALFPRFFFGQNSLLRNITRFLHVCWKASQSDPERARESQREPDRARESRALVKRNRVWQTLWLTLALSVLLRAHYGSVWLTIALKFCLYYTVLARLTAPLPRWHTLSWSDKGPIWLASGSKESYKWDDPYDFGIHKLFQNLTSHLLHWFMEGEKPDLS